MSGATPVRSLAMRLREIWMASAFIAAFVPAAAEPAHVILHNAFVEHQPEHPSAVSGVLAICIRIDVRTAKGERFPVYQYYLSDKQSIPTAGGGCTIEYHSVKATTCETGLAKEELLHPQATIRMADRIACSVAPL
jgi:hypothetical protein